MIDENFAELSASNAVLVSQSEATNSQLSSLEIILTETKEKLKCDRVIHRQALDETEVRVREIEGDFKDFRSELDGLYKETKELRMKLKAEKDRHKVEMEEMMTQFGETEFTCKLEGPTAVTLSLSAAKKEPVIEDSSPSRNNRSRKRTR